MLSLLSALVLSGDMRSVNSDLLLSQSGAPEFQKLDQEKKFNSFQSRVGIDKTLNGSSNQKREDEFYLSSIYIDDGVIFENNTAFGETLSSGSGGAVFISYSVLMGGSSNGNISFKSNSASSGGAICSLASKILLNKPEFDNNLAYKLGGAIFFQGMFESKGIYSSSVVIHTLQGQFINNKASFLGGAIAISNTGSPSHFENVNFTENFAGFSGGAIYLLNAPVSIYSSRFVGNLVDFQEVKSQSRNNSNSHFRSRGGGAIFFVSDAAAGGTVNRINRTDRNLYTQECCFWKNYAKNSTSFGDGPGNNILLEGFTFWSSNLDSIVGYTGNISDTKKFISSAENTDINGKPVIQVFEIIEKQSCDIDIKANEQDINEVQLSYQSLKRTGSGATSYIPSASIFTYVASPITQLPYATTQSYIELPTANTAKFSVGTLRTIRPTPVNTLIPTPDITLAPTPDITLAPTPDITLAPTPDITLAPTPDITLAPTPDITLAPTPDITLAPTVTHSSGDSTATLPLSTDITLAPTLTPSSGNATSSSSASSSKSSSSSHSSKTTIILTSTISFVPTVTHSLSSTIIPTFISGTVIDYPTNIIINISTVTEINVQSYTNSFLAEDGQLADDHKKKNLIPIIVGAAVGGVALIAIIAVATYFIVRKNKDQNSDSTIEMAEETMVKVPDIVSSPVTNDNPLWTSNVCDAQDPFKNDFEEVTQD